MHPNKKYEEVPDIELNSMDKSILFNLILGYTPATNITRNIMQKVSTDHLSDGIVSFYLCILPVTENLFCLLYWVNNILNT